MEEAALMRESIEEIANKLCYCINGDFDFYIKTNSKNESIQKLSLLLNFVLDSVRRGIASQKEQNAILLENAQKLIEASEIKKQHELELAHYARRSSMGELASGIAHQLSQPLGSIVHYIGGCLQRLNDCKDSKDIINAMKKASVQAEKCGSIIRSMKEFIKPGELKKTRFNLDDLISDILNFLQYKLDGAKIQLHIERYKNPILILANKIQIEQIVLNIFNNAIDAMNHPHVSLRKLKLTTSINAAGKTKIWIEDTGIGIKDEDIDNIYEPFFTSKEAGMGIGLSITRSLIESYGGHLSVSSKYQLGTQVTIILPLS